MPAILAVDDNTGVLNLLESLFTMADYTVFKAAGGQEALDVFRREGIDLVITDVNMPGMGGVELLKKLREIRPSVLAVAMSGYFDPYAAARAGFDAFISKPFKLDILLEVVDDMLSEDSESRMKPGDETAIPLPHLLDMLSEDSESGMNPPRQAFFWALRDRFWVKTAKSQRETVRKVLIVDDMPEMRVVVRTLVERLGLLAVEAGDGAEALKTLEKEGADLVISDCAMPVMDGRDFLAEVRRRFPNLLIVVTSANFKLEDVEALKPFGFLPKPYRLDDLKEILLKAVSQSTSDL